MTPEQRFKCMSHNRAKNTGPELSLRHALWRQGFRYRINDKRLPGMVPKTNTEFWAAKVARNQERDQEVWRKLEAKGWSVVIVWECQLKKANIDATVARVSDEIVRNGEAYRVAQEERRKAREEYRQERKARKEREQSLLKEVKSL